MSISSHKKHEAKVAHTHADKLENQSEAASSPSPNRQKLIWAIIIVAAIMLPIVFGALAVLRVL